VSVNLSAKQFYDANLLDFVVEQLEKTGVDPFYFELEFTEDVLLGDAEKALQIMERMRSLRIALSLDNYGSGYSFISYMTRMPVRYLKVHGTLTENTTENADVMRGLISIAHGLKMEVVAEQVETLAEACALKELGCDYVQGYVFSKPVPHDQAELLFDSDYGDVLVCGGIEEES
jgi:EAL domain-containing protein (putative c-di-GMP-specific phosphodiesterase class I)